MEQLIIIFQKNNLCMECIFESDIYVSISNTSFKGYQSKSPDFNEILKRGSFTYGPISHDCFSLYVNFKFVSPIILLLNTQVEVDLE